MQITEMIAELNLSSGEGTAIDLLVTAHRSGGAGAPAPEYEKLCTDLIATQEPGNWALTDATGLRELAAVAVHGDPEHWPGLTSPAVDALGAHLQEMADDGQENNSGRGLILMDALRAHEGSLEQYERLNSVLKGLAELLPHLPKTQTSQAQRYSNGWFAALSMAEMLRDAPTQALAGPMQPLVQAFGQRILDKKVSRKERQVLEEILAGRLLNSPRAEALHPIEDAL